MRKMKEMLLKLPYLSGVIVKQKQHHMLKSLEVSATLKYVRNARVLFPHNFPIKFIHLPPNPLQSVGTGVSRLPQTQLTVALITIC